ncbi:hypothetical protein Tco_1011067, partial [Tanacetum coccineum]
LGPDLSSKAVNETQYRDQVEFIFEEIYFTINNEVALLYPSHSNLEYFKEVSDFISKCCLKEAFIRASTQYKEYLSKFWYTTKILDDSKIWVSTPTGGIREDIDVPVDPKAPKPSSQTKEVPKGKKLGAKMVSQMHKGAQQAAGGLTSLGATSEKGAHPQLNSGHDASADYTAEADPRLSTPNDSIPSQHGMDKGIKNYSVDHIFAGTNPSVLVDQTKSAGDGLKTAHTDSSINEESRADDISKKIKIEDLSDLLKDTRSAFFTPDSSQDEPIIISDESE